MRSAAILLLLVTGIYGPVSFATPGFNEGVRIKELCRIVGARENALIGYGLVTGLAGTGDTIRSAATFQSISNVLKSFGLHVSPKEVRSRNVASVMISATLPPYARSGDKLDVNITSLGDAKSLLGGTLLRTHLEGPDGKIYGLAQGPVSVGGYSYDLNGNLVQKNHPTAAYISGGAVVEKRVETEIVDDTGKITYALYEPDFTTAERIAETVNQKFNEQVAKAIDAGSVSVSVSEARKDNVVRFITEIENISVRPDQLAKVVVNERTGTVVSGGDVKVSKVSITHGDLKVFISTEYDVSQPNALFTKNINDQIGTVVVPKTKMEVKEEQPMSVTLPGDTTVADLVAALNRVKASSRDIITILQSVKRAGGLHAELIVQ